MNIEQVRMPAAVKDFYSLLRFLEDKEAYKKQMAALEKATDDLNKRFDKLGTAKNIEELRAKAEAANIQAQDALKKAHEKVKQMDAGIQEALQKNREEERRLQSAAADAAETARKQQSAMAEQRKALNEDRKRMERLTEQAQRDQKKAQALRKEFEEKLNNMRQFSAAL